MKLARFSTAIRILAAAWIVWANVAAAAAPEIILVMGATGRQGAAVVDELLARGYAVRGMTRSPQSKKARRLTEQGVTVVPGDYRDPDSLRAAMEGAQGAFYYSGLSRDELTEARNVIAAAGQAGIKHLVYSSGAAAEPGVGMPDAAKTQAELALRDSGVPFSVLRPVAFMENFDRQQRRTWQQGVIDSRAPDRIVCFIAIRDIGFFVGEAFANPDEWLGRSVNIAGDRMTLTELAATFGVVLGRDVTYVRRPLDAYLQAFPPPLRPLFRWYDEVGYDVDAAGWRARYPRLTTLEAYLRRTGWENWRPDPPNGQG